MSSEFVETDIYGNIQYLDLISVKDKFYKDGVSGMSWSEVYDELLAGNEVTFSDGSSIMKCTGDDDEDGIDIWPLANSPFYEPDDYWTEFSSNSSDKKEEKCKHENTFVNHAGGIKFKMCSDCKKDLGNVN